MSKHIAHCSFCGSNGKINKNIVLLRSGENPKLMICGSCVRSFMSLIKDEKDDRKVIPYRSNTTA